MHTSILVSDRVTDRKNNFSLFKVFDCAFDFPRKEKERKKEREKKMRSTQRLRVTSKTEQRQYSWTGPHSTCRNSRPICF